MSIWKLKNKAITVGNGPKYDPVGLVMMESFPDDTLQIFQDADTGKVILQSLYKGDAEHEIHICPQAIRTITSFLKLAISNLELPLETSPGTSTEATDVPLAITEEPQGTD